MGEIPDKRLNVVPSRSSSARSDDSAASVSASTSASVEQTAFNVDEYADQVHSWLEDEDAEP